jgi:toxin ParE1/3/4
MPNKKIIVSEAAYADLDETFSYIASDLGSPGAAGNLIDKIFDSMERLADFPLMGSIADNDILNAKGYRLLPVDHFIVFYIPKDEEVHIVRVIYGRRNWEAILLGKS